jgi:hypothetical protein
VEIFLLKERFMKTEFYLIAILTLSFQIYAYAQTNKGNVLLNGSISYSYETSDYTNSYIKKMNKEFISISPSIGVFIYDNIVCGLVSDISKINIEETTFYIEERGITIYSGGILLRYYLPFSTFAGFCELSMMYGVFQEKIPFSYFPDVTGSYFLDGSQSQLNPAIGLVWFINKTIGIELKFSFQNQYKKYDFSKKFDLQSQLLINGGIHIVIPLFSMETTTE